MILQYYAVRTLFEFVELLTQLHAALLRTALHVHGFSVKEHLRPVVLLLRAEELNHPRAALDPAPLVLAMGASQHLLAHRVPADCVVAPAVRDLDRRDLRLLFELVEEAADHPLPRPYVHPT